MKLITKVELSSAVRRNSDPLYPYIYAVILTVIALCQLFNFDSFPNLLSVYEAIKPTVVAALLVVVEVLALPFLVQLDLSREMRWLSMACGLVASLAWVAISAILVITGYIGDTGMLGGLVPFGALPSLFLGLIMLCLMWSSIRRFRVNFSKNQ